MGKAFKLYDRHPGLLNPDSLKGKEMLDADKAQSAMVYGGGTATLGAALIAKKLLKKRAGFSPTVENEKYASFSLSDLPMNIPTEYEVNVNAPKMEVDNDMRDKALAALLAGGAALGAGAGLGNAIVNKSVAGGDKAVSALRSKLLKK